MIKSRIIAPLLVMTMLHTVCNGPANCAERGETPPAFVLEDEQGNSVRLADFAGEVIILDFWASWCTSCRHSLLWLSDLEAEYAARGLRVLTINLDTDRGVARYFLDRIHLTRLRVLYDPQGKTAERFGLKSIPGSFLIGRDGRIAAIHYNLVSEAQRELTKQIEEALRQ